MSDYADYILELLKPMHGVSAKRMFGGHGIFKNGLMFALLADDEIYLKADQKLIPEFEKLNCEQFTYFKKGKPFKLGYFKAPPEALDVSHIMCEWGEKSYAAALRARAINAKTRKKSS